MPVGSTIELYTSLLGWVLYDALWAMMASSGLILIPFIAVTVMALIDTRDSAVEITSDGLLRIIETRIYTMIFVVFFAVQPQIYNHPSKTTYTQYRCGVTSSGSLMKTATELSFGDSESSLDKTSSVVVMLDGKIPEVPLWWYLVTKLSHAITQAARQELPCQADMRTLASGLSGMNINDTLLKDETKDFYQQCWQPAVNKFGSERLPESELPTKFKDGEIYDDIAWPGSEFFLNRAGYYDTLRTSKELSAEHFPYNEARDSIKMPPPPSGVELGGYPTCHEWWLGYPATGSSFGSDHGLRTRLLDHLKSTGADDDCEDCAGAWWKFWASDKFATTEDRDNALIQSALSANQSEMELSLTNGSTEFGGAFGSTADQMTRGIKSMVGAIGLIWEGGKKMVETEMVRQVAPIVQSMVLMVFTVVLPFLLAIGTFSLSSLMSLTLVQFSIIFWGFLFSLAAWVDNFLLSGLWSSADKNPTLLLDTISPVSTGVGTHILAISWVTYSLYMLAPLAFTYFLGVAGVKAGDSVSKLINPVAGEIGGAGSRGGGTISRFGRR